MSASAIIMMVISIVLVWGGLMAAIVNLTRSARPTPGETNRDL